MKDSAKQHAGHRSPDKTASYHLINFILFCFVYVFNCPECGAGTYGAGCSQDCSSRCRDRLCDKLTGDCTHGCAPGFDPKLNCMDSLYHSISLVILFVNKETFLGNTNKTYIFCVVWNFLKESAKVYISLNYSHKCKGMKRLKRVFKI